MKEKLYIVTGALGHLGNHVINKLKELGVKVRGFDLKKDSKYVKEDNNTTLYTGDINNESDLNNVFDGSENYDTIVIHCAGIVSITSKYDQKIYDVNVNGTKKIVDMCIYKKIKKLIYISSVHAIKEGKGIIYETNEFNSDEVKGLYAKTKAMATKYVLDSVKRGLNVSVIHPSGIIGPNDPGPGHITQLLIDYLNGNLKAIVKGGYDFVDVRDVTEAIISSIDNGKNGECYIISNKYFSIKELLNELHKITNLKEIKTILPLWIAKFTSPLAELYYRIKKQKPLYTSYSLYTLESNSLFSHDKATKELNYYPRSINETLTDTYKWIKNLHNN